MLGLSVILTSGCCLNTSNGRYYEKPCFYCYENEMWHFSSIVAQANFPYLCLFVLLYKFEPLMQISFCKLRSLVFIATMSVLSERNDLSPEELLPVARWENWGKWPHMFPFIGKKKALGILLTFTFSHLLFLSPFPLLLLRKPGLPKKHLHFLNETVQAWAKIFFW